jgi:glyoxylate/hydroxypyruvate reductase A
LTRDTLLFYSAFDDPVAWRRALQAELPDLDVRIHPDTGDTEELDYALVWKPPESNGLLGAREFALLPKGAKLINVSRGAVVDEAAMIEGLHSGQIGAATLDVFAVEPLREDHALWHIDNVLITPHLASITVPEAAARDVAESIRRVRAGLEPLHRTDPGRGY